MHHTLITDENRRFLILGAPESTKNLTPYLQVFGSAVFLDLNPRGKQKFVDLCDQNESNKVVVQLLKDNNVVVLVRACESNYPTDLFEAEGIKVYDLCFQDGGVPSRELIVKWLDLVETTFPKTKNRENDILTIPPTLAVHCQAGLGRAPLLVTIALIENGMDNLSAVNYVRERRRDAFNKQQLNFLVHYKPIRKNCHCLVM